MPSPAGTLSEVMEPLQRGCAGGLRSAAVAERFAHEDAVPSGMASADPATFIAQEQTPWKRLVARAGIKTD